MEGVFHWAREFARWWWGELAALIPEAARAAVLGSPVSVGLDREGLFISTDPHSSCPDGPHAGLAERPETGDAIERLGKKGGLVELTLGESVCLIRTTSVPASAMSRAKDILALQLERITPFRRDDVCFGWRLAQARQSGPNTLLVQAVVRRDLLAGASERLFAVGFTQVRAVCRVSDGGDIAISLPAGLSRPKSRLLRWLSAASRISAIVTAVAMAATILLAFAKQHGALAALDNEIGAMRAAAQNVRVTYDAALASGLQVRTLRQRKLATPTVAAMLEEITRVLPDTAWITDFRMDRGQLTITGFAQSAADLIPAVEASDLFANAEFVSPVVHAPRENGDRFNIGFQVVASATPAEDAQ